MNPTIAGLAMLAAGAIYVHRTARETQVSDDEQVAVVLRERGGYAIYDALSDKGDAIHGKRVASHIGTENEAVAMATRLVKSGKLTKGLDR